jgi:hypothetical protein
VKVNDTVDGQPVTKVEAGTDSGGFTYDLLPAGDTGFYWANGVLVASTLTAACQ